MGNKIERWNFLCLLVRKQGGGHGQRFEVLAANIFDDIEKELVSKEGEELGGQEFSYHPGLRRDIRLRRLGLIGGEKQADMAMSSIAMTPKDIEADREEKRRAAQMEAANKIMAAQKNKVNSKSGK